MCAIMQFSQLLSRTAKRVLANNLIKETDVTIVFLVIIAST